MQGGVVVAGRATTEGALARVEMPSDGFASSDDLLMQAEHENVVEPKGMP